MRHERRAGAQPLRAVAHEEVGDDAEPGEGRGDGEDDEDGDERRDAGEDLHGDLRTRAALVHALAQHVAAGLTDDVEALSRRLEAHPGDAAFAARRVSDLFTGWLRDRDVLVTRLELTLEAARDDELAHVFVEWRGRLVDVVEQVVARSRDTDPRRHAEAVVAALEGVLLSALAQPSRHRRAFVTRTVDTVLAALAQAPTQPDGPVPAPR